MTSVVMNWDSQTQSVEQLMQQAIQQFEAGQHAQAERLCRQALTQNAGSAEAENMLGVLAHMRGDLDEALAHMRQAMTLAPDQISHMYNMAQIALEKGDLELAKTMFDKVLSVSPTYADALKYRLKLAFDEKDFTTAERYLKMVLQQNPDHPQITTVLIQTLQEQKKYQEALPLYRKLLASSPDHTAAFLASYGMALHHEGAYAEAVAQFEQAIAKGMNDAEIFFCLGLSYDFMGDYRRAELYYGEAASTAGGHRPSQDALVTLKLKTSNLKENLDKYAVRHAYGTGHERLYPFTQWAGQPLAGKKILLWAEQGAGDMLMFAGFLPYVMEQAASVTLLVYPGLIDLFARSFPKARIRPLTVEADEEIIKEGFDFHAPMGNLLMLLHDYQPRTRQGYLVADPTKVAAFKDRYTALGKGKKIGISWFTEKETSAKARSIPLSLWQPIFSVPDTQFISLQYGVATQADISALEKSAGIQIHFDPSVDPLTDKDLFAAQVAALDGVISIQNTTVHMGGALGKPTVIMLPRRSDFRWGVERDDNYWYPSVTVLRQPTYGDWSAVISRAAQWLSHLKSS